IVHLLEHLGAILDIGPMIDLTDQLLERLVLLGVQLLLEEIEHRRERGLVGRVGLTVPLRLSAGVKRMPRLQRADHLVQLGRSLRRQRALEELSDGSSASRGWFWSFMSSSP